MTTVFGIPNCDTIKKARTWLDTHTISYEFHDYKKAGADAALISAWVARVGWQTLLNTRGTTWRGLSDAERTDVDQAKAIALMHAKPSLIRRPVIETGVELLVGFDASAYERAFLSRS